MSEEFTSPSVDTDNSEISLEEQVIKALDEPVDTDEGSDNQEDVAEDVENKEQADNTFEGVPDKFKNKDGSIDVSKLAKSYRELESMQSSKATQYEQDRAELEALRKEKKEEAERREKEALEAGYESQMDMEQAFTVANFEANEYMKYLQYTDDPEEVEKLIIKYNNTADPAILEEIQMEFSPQITTRIAVQADRIKQDFEKQKAEFEQTQMMGNIENVLGQTVSENPEHFAHKPMKDLFINILGKYGNNFTFADAKLLLGTFDEMKEIYRQEFAKEHGLKIANDKATDKLAAITGTNSAPAASQKTSIDKMSNVELAKFVRNCI